MIGQDWWRCDLTQHRDVVGAAQKSTAWDWIEEIGARHLRLLRLDCAYWYKSVFCAAQPACGLCAPWQMCQSLSVPNLYHVSVYHANYRIN